MTTYQILFFIFSGCMLMAGLAVIASRNPVNSAMALVVLFFFMAAHFILLDAWFLAAVQILVYAGAVMVLFLFVIMLMNVEKEERSGWKWGSVIAATSISLLLLAEFVILFWLRRTNLNFHPSTESTPGTTQAVGKLLFSKYLLPFEVASLILLAAMIGVIWMNRRHKS